MSQFILQTMPHIIFLMVEVSDVQRRLLAKEKSQPPVGVFSSHMTTSQQAAEKSLTKALHWHGSVHSGPHHQADHATPANELQGFNTTLFNSPGRQAQST